MNRLRISKKFNFEAAHALYGYDGKCRNIHGHSYSLKITLIGEVINDLNSPKLGMVIDVSDLKRIVEKEIIDKLDHSIIINKNSPNKILGDNLIDQGHKVVFLENQPTSENIIIHIKNKLENKFPNNVIICKIKLKETETSSFQWVLGD